MLHNHKNAQAPRAKLRLENRSSVSQNGCPIITRATIEADRCAAEFSYDPTIHRKAFIDAAMRAAPALGYGAAAMNLLRILFDHTRQIDWEDGRPICFASNEHLAGQIGKTVSAVKKQLRELAQAGLIARAGDGNGKRIGGRYGSGARKGHLRDETTGINLAPIAAKYEEHLAAIEQYRLEQEQLRTMAITARRFLRNIAQMRQQCVADGIPEDAWEGFSILADQLGPEILAARHGRNVERLAIAINRLGEAHVGMTALLRTQFDRENDNKFEPQGGKKCPHIPSTTPEDISDGIQGLPEARRSNGLPDTNDPGHPETYTEHGAIKASEIPHLFPNFGAFWSDRSQTQTFEAIARCISQGGHSFIGLKLDLWNKALAELPLGYPQIMFAIALEWLAANPGQRNAGGYFIGMVKKYHAGQLNLHATIMKRRKSDNLTDNLS